MESGRQSGGRHAQIMPTFASITLHIDEPTPVHVGSMAELAMSSVVRRRMEAMHTLFDSKSCY